MHTGARGIVRWILAAAACMLSLTSGAVAQTDEFEKPPIEYSKSVPTDAVARLTAKLKSGTTQLLRDDAHGYLRSLLKELDIPESSQTLVFSKTSFQRHRINPRKPRAVYFNDDVYVGWVRHGDVIEISTADARLGAVFYTLDQEPTTAGTPPQILRQKDHCLICHASSQTGRVPGHLMRSVFPDRGGMPVFSCGTYRTTHKSPLTKRWGGWYVTGTHGRQRHMGNELIAGKRNPEALDSESGANVTDLSDRFATAPYLTPHSDIVALMVLSHQVFVHNAIASANFSALRTRYDARIMNNALGRESDFESESTRRRYRSAAEKLVKALLMSDEARLVDPIAGTSSFVKDFRSRGPFDRQNRSLRQFDLKRRMFRYPCSYLIYSDAFTGLPQRLLKDVYHHLWSVLNDQEPSDDFAHLSVNDRKNLREILIATVPNLPDAWR